MTATDQKYLLLINKQNKVDESFAPSPLKKVKDTHKDIELELTVARALEAMFIEMRAAGVGEGVFVTSAYRSYTYQNWLFGYYIEEEKSKDRTLTDAEARDRVLHYSAAPGTSEHQSGLSVDLMTNGMRELDESFADEPVYDWLLENAWKFGFILRFPKDKTDITGYDYEPWHYRFVGRENAYQIWSQNLCLEEFLAQK
jgi:D-alanyl-D-alanine carboxypeptidase